MRKYGIEHFHIELIEETNNPEEREVYWIEEYRSFKYGYNATKGGDGKPYLDYDLILATYKELGNCVDTAKKCGCCADSVKKILKENNIKPDSKAAVVKKCGKTVNQYDLSGNYIKSFPSLSEAAREIGNFALWGNIGRAASGKRKTAYGYIWRYAELDNI